MDDFISREKAINKVSEWLNMAKCPYNQSAYNCGEIAAYETCLEDLKNLPAADVRPVVLCRDCGHCIDGFICKNGHWNGMTFPSNFCSDGERKEGADGDKREES